MDIYPNTVLKKPEFEDANAIHRWNKFKEDFSGLCKLLERFSLPIREKCEEWVYDEFLPPIRKSGGYRLPAAKKTASPE